MTDTTKTAEALVEDGWEALANGDVEQAEGASEAALREHPSSIDALSLAAAIAVARGEIDRSLELCRRAIAVDPEDPRPYIQAAEAELYSDNYAAAIELAVKAVDRAGDEADFVDAILVKAEAELSMDNVEDAQRTMSELDACKIDEPPLLFRSGQLWLELDDADRAHKAFAECIRQEPSSADAHHGLGLACDELGDEAGMLEAWRKVKAIDAQTPPPPWHLSLDDFRSIATTTLNELPKLANSRIADAHLDIEDVPTDESVSRGLDPRALSQFEGTQAEQADAALERIRIYRLNVERSCQSPDEIAGELRVALLQEAAVFFDIDNDELAALA